MTLHYYGHVALSGNAGSPYQVYAEAGVRRHAMPRDRRPAEAPPPAPSAFSRAVNFAAEWRVQCRHFSDISTPLIFACFLVYTRRRDKICRLASFQQMPASAAATTPMIRYFEAYVACFSFRFPNAMTFRRLQSPDGDA